MHRVVHMNATNMHKQAEVRGKKKGSDAHIITRRQKNRKDLMKNRLVVDVYRLF